MSKRMESFESLGRNINERPPPEGLLLFRFKPPKMSKRQTGLTGICEEYAVTALTKEDIESSKCLAPHNSVIIWGWIGWKNDWEANVSGRPVVFELLRRLLVAAVVSGALVTSPRIRLPGEPD